MKPYTLAEAPNQEEQQFGVGGSKDGRVYIRIGNHSIFLQPEKAVEVGQAILRLATMVVKK